MDDQSNSDITKVLTKIANITDQGEKNKALAGYAEKLIEEKGFPDISVEVKEELKKDILEQLDDFISARIITTLSDEDVLKFEEMLKSGKPEEEVQQFVVSHIDDFTNFLTGVLLEFRSVYLGLISPPDSINPDAVVSQPLEKVEEPVSINPVDLAPPPPPPPAPVAPEVDKTVN